MRNGRGPFACGLAILLGLSVFVGLRLRVSTDIESFLPSGQATVELDLARAMAVGELSRTLVLVVTPLDPERIAADSRRIEAALRAEPDVAAEIATLQGGPPDGLQRATWEIYRPRLLGFAADSVAKVKDSLTDAALSRQVEELKRQLASPMSTLLTQVAPEDPLLILPEIFERLQGRRDDGLTVVDGRFATADGTGAVFLLTTRSASTNAPRQEVLLAGVRRAIATVEGLPADASLMMSGGHRYAVRAAEAIRSDIERVSIGSAIALTLILLLAYRSLRLLMMVVPVVSFGFVVAAATCIVLFGQIHGLTLAFGAALIGVSIDYAVHFYSHHELAPHPDGPDRTLASIWPGLTLGAATTVVGFIALLVSSFAGLRELAIFAAVGISAALLATRLLLPFLAGASRERRSVLQPVMGWRPRSRTLPIALGGLMVLLAAIGIPQVVWNDDIADLNRLDPDLLAEDASVRKLVHQFEQSRIVIALGDDEQSALEKNDRVALALDAQVDSGGIDGFRGLATMLTSAARQRAIAAAVRDSQDLWPRLEAALSKAGFRPEGFAPFRDSLAGPAPAPLQWADLVASPFASLIRHMRLELPGGDAPRVAFLTFIRGVNDSAALRRAVTGAGGLLVDVRGEFTAAYRGYRERMTGLLLLGLIAVIALVAIRHRRARIGMWRQVVSCCGPAFLGAAGTVGALALLGVPLNVLSLVALLMIVSMGVDYGVFLAEDHDESRAIGASRVAVLVAACSTLAGFGFLSLSRQPGLHSIGVTALVGVIFCLVLALAMQRRQRG